MSDLMTTNQIARTNDPEEMLLTRIQPGHALEAQVRGEIDIQISTANAYPRSITKFLDNALTLCTYDEETAQACIYSLPRGGKNIEGPSVRLAEIVASSWKHLRVQTRVIGLDDQFVTVEGVCWDLENNVAISTQVRRRITDRNGKRLNDDMIVVTTNAASAIARRNAIFAVIPNAYTQKLYQAARKCALGDIKTLATRRGQALEWFNKRGVSTERILASLELKGIEDVGMDQLATLIGICNAVKNGEVSIDDAFALPATVVSEGEAPKKRGAAAARERAQAAAASTEQPAPPTEAPKNCHRCGLPHAEGECSYDREDRKSVV